MGSQIADASTRSDTVQRCVEKILKSAEFRASGRAKLFLGYVVQETLEGRQSEIKERTIAFEVFHRAADFEPAEDAVVRVSANEVRRRLAQYYAASGTEDAIRISLPHGTYIPEFEWVAKAPESASEVVESPASWGHPLRRYWKGIAGGAVLVAIFGLGVWLRPSSPLDRLWGPITGQKVSPILCLPASDTFQSSRLSGEVARALPGQKVLVEPDGLQVFHNWHTSLPVLQSAMDVTAVLARKDHNPVLRIGVDLRADELRGHPIIAIGSFSNLLVKQKSEGLRFTFDRGAADNEVPRIRDRQNPNRFWTLKSTYPAEQDRDYAIITRVFDDNTGLVFLSLAGLHSFGCQMAGEFVTDPVLWADFARRAPKGWETANFQVVLESRVVGTTPNAPRVLDTHFWTGTEQPR